MRPLSFQYSQNSSAWNVTLIDCPHYASYRDIARQMYSGFPKTTENTDILIIRLPVDRSLSAIDDEIPALGDFVDRFPKASIHVLYITQFETELSANINSAPGVAAIPREESARFLTWL